MLSGGASLFLVAVISCVVAVGIYVFFAGKDIYEHGPFYDEDDD